MLCLFADDCILYRTIKSVEDSVALQEDLERLSHWALTWQMKFNVAKCIVIRCSRSSTPIRFSYCLDGHILGINDEHPYLI